MKPLTSVREYHYWSERLVNKIWQDNIQRLPNKFQVSAGVSNFGVKVQAQDSPNTKAARAAAIGELLADHIVTDFDYAGPLQYLAGRSAIVLSSLQYPSGHDTGSVTLFADLTSAQGKRVAVCLFGSARNVCDYDPTPPEWRRYGWTSSSDKGVELLLLAGMNAEDSSDPAAFWQQTAERKRAELFDICWDAQNICANQGMGGHHEPELAWRRGYTIGHYNDAEWLAQIYFTHADPSNPCDEYDVVHVGAAFWVRTGSPRAWVPYTETSTSRLDAAQHSLVQRPFARVKYYFRDRRERARVLAYRSSFPRAHRTGDYPLWVFRAGFDEEHNPPALSNEALHILRVLAGLAEPPRHFAELDAILVDLSTSSHKRERFINAEVELIADGYIERSGMNGPITITKLGRTAMS